jgi:hypothetical protein
VYGDVVEKKQTPCPIVEESYTKQMTMLKISQMGTSAMGTNQERECQEERSVFCKGSWKASLMKSHLSNGLREAEEQAMQFIGEGTFQAYNTKILGWQ